MCGTIIVTNLQMSVDVRSFAGIVNCLIGYLENCAKVSRIYIIKYKSIGTKIKVENFRCWFIDSVLE